MLHFDAYQRCETVKQLLNWMLQGEPVSILDVGGYPGRMRTWMPEHEWVLCDPRVDAPGLQVKGSGAALPFADGAFEVAVSLDVLEHVPPLSRFTMLSEMRRVARRGMVLSFPRGDQLVTQSEDLVREVYQRLQGKPHPWLHEHAQHALPDVEVLTEHMRALGGAVKVFPLGALHRWTQWQLLSVFFEAMPNMLESAGQLDALYEASLFGHEFQAPSYRVVVLHLFDTEAEPGVELIETAREEETAADLQGLRALALDLAKRLQSHHEVQRNQENQREAARLEQDYLKRLEQGLRDWEASYARALQETREAMAWRHQLEGRLSFRLYRKLMRLLGARI